ncbi:ferredoxin [Jannaschia sp. W003]|uniref:ferredoxin n=1 Tax=Jannaschia sp. W003 TaxID=2867012 RepID=UPI0021A54B87|nr:ferredoxin [Jannaschia sp. W003]UWQ21208.1 ferredoxin [Jannaschia sp. W003]
MTAEGRTFNNPALPHHRPQPTTKTPAQARGDLAQTLAAAARARALVLLGVAPGGIALLGPDPARFWSALAASPEWGAPDPVDRWSARVVGAWADELDVEARFPFGDPPAPFVRWALASGCHLSPVGMLVHPEQGLTVSFRGALVVPGLAATTAPDPCTDCSAPCRTACPVGALREGYDVAACRAWLGSPQGDCLARGCAARRACPLSQPRPDAQSAHHMRHFA